MIVLVDTSALIALLDEDDLRHHEAVATFRWLAKNVSLVTHNYVEVEAVAVAERRFGAPAARQLTDLIFPILRTIWIDEQTHTNVLSTRRTARGASLVDQISFAVMRSNAIDTVFAYDADFEREGFELARVPGPLTAERQVHEGSAPYGDAVSDDLVSVAEISARAGRPVNTIQSWRRRHADFPTPLTELAAGPIWSWPTVATWIASRPKHSGAESV